nr:hypothetical protein [Tanacetum cinerariifolium]
DHCTRNETSLTLSWKRVSRLDSGVREPIVEFSEGKVGVYTKFFKFTNFLIGAAKVSHFEINCRVLNIIPTLNLFRVFYVPSFNSGWMSFSKRPRKNTPQCYTKPLDSLKNWNNRFFWIDEKIFPTVVEWCTNALKNEMPSADMDLFSLISTPNPAKVKIETRPRVAHKVLLLTATATRVIDMEDTAVASGSSGTPSAVEKSLLDFIDEDPPQVIIKRGEEATTEVLPESSMEKEVAAMGPVVNKRHRKRRNEEAGVNAPLKVLRKDYATSRPAQRLSCCCKEREQSRSAILCEPQPHPERDIAQSSRETATEVPTGHVATTEVQGGIFAESPESGKSTLFLSMDGSPEGIYQPGWGVTNNCRLDTPNACQDMVGHVVPPAYFSELRHLLNTDFLIHYNMNLARQVAMDYQLRLRFEQEVRLLKKATAKIAERDQRIKAREEEIKKLDQEIKSPRTVEMEVHGLRNQAKNLKTLLEAGVDMKKAAEAKNARLAKELEIIRAQFADLQVSNNQLSQQVSTLQAQVTGEERIKAAFEKFKKYKDDRVNSKCVEIDARLDALSIDFDEELYPHMLTAIAGMREGLKHEIENGKAKLDLAAIEAYDSEADAKYVAALHALKDLKYPLVDQLEKLKDAPIDLIMASLYLESDSGEDAPQWIQEILLKDAIAANISRAEKKKKCRVVCRTHGVGSAHHARFDGVLVSVPTVAPQGLDILLADAAA